MDDNKELVLLGHCRAGFNSVTLITIINNAIIIIIIGVCVCVCVCVSSHRNAILCVMLKEQLLASNSLLLPWVPDWTELKFSCLQAKCTCALNLLPGL